MKSHEPQDRFLWQHPTELNTEDSAFVLPDGGLDELLTGCSRLDREAKYVIYCAFGLQSAVVAEKMQRAGFEAYSFKGGSRSLKALADALDGEQA